MKKVIIIVCIVLVVLIGGIFLFTGNGDVSVKQDNTKVTTKKGIKLTYEGVNIAPGEAFDASKIKKEAIKTEVPSCATEGMDNVYEYDGIQITTNVINNKEKVYDVYFLNESVKTDEGIHIGNTVDELKSAYPDIEQLDDATYSYELREAQILFLIKEDKVTTIEYFVVMSDNYGQE